MQRLYPPRMVSVNDIQSGGPDRRRAFPGDVRMTLQDFPHPAACFRNLNVDGCIAFGALQNTGPQVYGKISLMHAA